MFTIKNEQMEKFDAIAYDDFVERMVAIIKEGFGDEVKESDDVLIELVVDLINEAQEYDIVNEEDVQDYIGIWYGSEIMRKEPRIFWIENILTQPDINGEKKIDVLRSRLFPDMLTDK